MRISGVIILAAVVVSCSSSTEPLPPGTVSVTNNNFSPAAITIDAGEEVTWTWNSGGAVHSVLFNVAAGAPADIPNTSTGSVSRDFITPGTFVYHCGVHGPAVMSGTVTVN